MKVIQCNATTNDANSYLINDNILIDTGLNGERLAREIESHIDLNKLELIILTHCHYDHTAAVPLLVELSGAKVGVHRADEPMLADDMGSVSTFFGQKAPVIDPDILYEDGDMIKLDEIEALQIIHTPGHTPGGICLYEPFSKSLFSGDTVFASGGFGRTDFEGGSARQLTESIQKLAEIDVETLYPGHGPVVKNDANRQIQLSMRASRTIW
ncbi:MBL fold metallo-hydrolase [Methanohalophilus portucalensis]|uniref:Beta-lactamase n=2 Tax=Methanohalophilus portucalensis TaxID=39664 RepID=A0A1L9C201_9EURY|nr:MBL fold metallo-hydrolase [Methanohalophilus portucalensis]ATU09062.1 MBL fold hydrolase [Methanohalophilus portucalensis]OJH48491.1 beta-lactamase [Methanohalophilus portucalensis FDF-1]RNI12513.1 MBL fold metallo-hydrolase [Methanohalophilus portucalensis FDF-1]SMH30268.1 Glyoxylase, beta-lactamase superfamily II [Methanohalophilus portucalensis FDF-1]